MQARREWQEIFKVMNSKNLQPRLLYPAKLSFRIEGQIKSFKDKKKLKEFITTKPVLYEKLKGAQGNLTSGGKPVSFLVDTGAAYSVLTEPMGPVTSKKTSVQEATRQTSCFPWTSKRTVDLGKNTVMLECRYPLLGCDLLKKLQATTTPAQPLNWTEVEQRAFEELKKALVSAPALALPDVMKLFHLYVSEVRGIAKGVLTQILGPWKRPVAYLSKRLDPVAAGWPACLWAVAATALLVKEADKQTLGQKLALTTPHAVEALLRGAPERWMSNTRITQCQAFLLDQPHDDLEEPIHDCTEVTDAVQTACPGLTDVLLSSPGKVLFTDGSSYAQDGIRYAGSAVVTLDHTIWAQSLKRGTSVQKAKLLALIKALRWGHSTNHRERGLPTSAGKDIKNKEEILALLEVIWLPRAIVHCKGHQKGETIEARGNRATDQTAKEAALKPVGPLQVLVTLPDPDLPQTPSYIKQEEELAEQKQAIKGPDGWWTLPDDRLLVPEALGQTLVAQLHQATHLGITKTSELLRGRYYIPSLDKIIKSIVTRSTVCAQGNPPGEHWEVDFTEIKPLASGYKYMLVLIDTFSGWVEAYPTRTETASIVVKRLLQEIIPRFGLPVVIGSDNSPAFVAKISQSIAQALGQA
ncbi:hypothetical protein QTO34_019520 [Cnephaeus nilssonii]|uniref:Gypsy retrotransposon integrase-like protein 1 n=1 Tax=Cnephaeus nilssonii TaxID=3371016 RepID=A0AA40HWV3_CNENI|nr:hypothetical protein QTO34_019520 [Eptesicus nilssonii]